MKSDEAYEAPLPAGATRMENVMPPPPAARDDFELIKKTLLDEEGRVKPTRPRSLDPCGVCGAVHEIGKNPICVCVKCHKLGRIEWCGQCTICAWTRFSDQFGEETADLVFPQYGAWRKGEIEKLKKGGLPWES